MKKLDIYIDGASKGNPGPSGIGVVICQGREVIKNISVFIGNATNNIAEYTALVYALEEALLLKGQELIIRTDSQLLARQLNKEYKVKDINIAVLYNKSVHLLKGFRKALVHYIPREENKGADKLATLAIKKFFNNKGQVECSCSLN